LPSVLPHQYASDDALVGGGIFPTHFFGQKIRPSLTTSKDGLKTLNIQIETTRI
jgi:hypothetical protein